MSRLALAPAIIIMLMLLGITTTLPAPTALGSVAPPELSYPDAYFNTSSVSTGPHINMLNLTILNHLQQLNAIELGNIDLMMDPEGLATTEIAAATSTSGVDVKSQSGFGFRWLGFNFRAWADPTLGANGVAGAALTRYKAFRQAVDLSIPRADIVSSQLAGNGFATCEAVTPAWVAYWHETGMCNQVGTTSSADRATAKTTLWSLLGTQAGGGNVFTNITSGCSGVTTGYCLGNGTTQIKLELTYPTYDPVRKYAGVNIAANLQAIGFGVVAIPVPFYPEIADFANYKFNMMIYAWGLSVPDSDVYYDSFATVNDACPLNSTAGMPGCASGNGNIWGLHDAILDGYLNIIHNSTSFTAIVTATKNALDRLYSQAEFLGLYTYAWSTAARIDKYSGIYNMPGAGIAGYNNFIYTGTLVQVATADFTQSLFHPTDDYARPYTVGVSSDIGYANRFDRSSIWDAIVNELYEGNNYLNFIAPNDYSLQPMTAGFPKITIMTVDGVLGEQIVYTLNPLGAGMAGMPVWLASGQFVTVNDYKNTLDYIEATKPANFAMLTDILSSYSVSGNQLTMIINATGYWPLYVTNIPPTYAPFWCNVGGGTPNCANPSKDLSPSYEPAAGSPEELNMAGNSTTGPFILVQHIPGMSFLFERNKDYWLGLACDRNPILGTPSSCPSAATTPVFSDHIVLLVTTLILSSTIMTTILKRRTRNVPSQPTLTPR